MASPVNPVPSWAQNIVANMQAAADKQYADKLAVYQQACADWINLNVLNRDKGLPITAVPPQPKRTLIHWDDVSQSFQQVDVTDPTMQSPVLPPPVPQQASVTLSTGAGEQSDKIDSMYSLIVKIAAVIGVK